MNATTPAEELEALRNKCALLGASLHQAEAEVEALKADRKTDPLLADVLAPAFEDANSAEINDALNWCRQLSGKNPSWAVPKQDVTVERHAFGGLLMLAYGCHSVAMLTNILRSVEDLSEDGATANGNLMGGLDCALEMLAEEMHDRLSNLR